MKTFVVCAGGSGGHVFPALALCEQLRDEGCNVIFLTDKRGSRYCSGDEKFNVNVMPDVSSCFKNIHITALNAIRIFIGLLISFRKKKPDIMIGFGGVPTIVPIVFAKLLGIKTVIHEPNAVFGKANKFLSKIANYTTSNYPQNEHPKCITLDTPVRKQIFSKFATPYLFKNKSKFVICVIGGSQSADIFSTVIPEAFRLLPQKKREFIKVVQQSSANKIELIKAAYNAFGIESDVREFLQDVGNIIANADLVISRAGASTLAELATIGRAAILIPYQYAGGHQYSNAEYYENLGAAWIIDENSLSPQVLADKLMSLFSDLDQLTIASVNMLKSRSATANVSYINFLKNEIMEETKGK